MSCATSTRFTICEISLRPTQHLLLSKNVVFDYTVFSLVLALKHAEKANIMAVRFRNVTRSRRCYCPFSRYFVGIVGLDSVEVRGWAIPAASNIVFANAFVPLFAFTWADLWQQLPLGIAAALPLQM